MPESLSDRYAELLSGSYDCADRIVLNAYFRMGHTADGFRVWWRALTGSDDTLDSTHTSCAWRAALAVGFTAMRKPRAFRLYIVQPGSASMNWPKNTWQDPNHSRLVSDSGGSSPGAGVGYQRHPSP
jgi:hypothetical protein